MGQDLSYQMKVSEAAVRIDAIYTAADPTIINVPGLVVAMKGVITLVSLNHGKEWSEVELDVLKALSELPGIVESLKDTVDLILHDLAVEIPTNLGDNIH